MPTKTEVITRAFRMLQVVADDESTTADQEAFGLELLEAIHEELMADAAPSFTLEDIPILASTHLASVLAADLAAPYNRPPPVSRGAAMVKLVATIRPDDRPEITDPEYF